MARSQIYLDSNGTLGDPWEGNQGPEQYILDDGQTKIRPREYSIVRDKLAQFEGCSP